MPPLRNPYRASVQALAAVHDGDDLPAELPPSPQVLAVMRAFRERYAYAIPDEALIRRIAREGTIVEPGAGTGYWAWLLRQAGAVVLASDRSPPLQFDPMDGRGPRPMPGVTSGAPNPWISPVGWTEVAQADVETALAQAPADAALLLVWPPFDDPMAVRALRAFRGRVVWYVGELRGGACADDDFFDALEEGWRLTDQIAITRWPGIQDWALRLERRSPTSPTTANAASSRTSEEEASCTDDPNERW